MEINITQFYNAANAEDYSASCAELGDNAGQITWNAALHADYNLIDTDDKRDALRKWAKSTVGWNAEEISAWSDNELNALFIQLISGDIREKGSLPWEEYQAESEAGLVSGALFEGIGGGIYYYLGE